MDMRRSWKIAKIVWFALSYAGLTALLLFLHGKMTISVSSLVPLMLAGIMLLQSLPIKYKRDGERLHNYAYTPLTEDENERYERLFSDVILCFLPFQLALVCFLSGFVKVILAAAVYFTALTCIAVFWRMLYGREVKARLKREEEELKAQIKRENQGKYR